MNEFEFPQETANSLEINEKPNENQDFIEQPRASISPSVLAYGANRITEIPEVREKINEVKDNISDTFHDAKDAVVEFGEKIKNGISDFCKGVYEKIDDFFTESKEVESKEFSRYSKEFSETREFGIQECSDAASKIFTPEVVDSWGVMSYEQRSEIAKVYADEVAQAFELVNYNGVIIEKMNPGDLGSNNGDGYIHISDILIEPWTTPFEIMNTVTHELRHQYQNECVRGYHDVADEVRTEWAVASAIYNYNQPSCFDPWGYTYNPLEIDSRYAGETVVRNVTSQFINNLA